MLDSSNFSKVTFANKRLAINPLISSIGWWLITSLISGQATCRHTGGTQVSLRFQRHSGFEGCNSQPFQVIAVRSLSVDFAGVLGDEVDDEVEECFKPDPVMLSIQSSGVESSHH